MSPYINITVIKAPRLAPDWLDHVVSIGQPLTDGVLATVVSRCDCRYCTDTLSQQAETELITVFFSPPYNYFHAYKCYSVSSVCLSLVTLCFVTKRCVLEQKFLLAAYRKS